MRQISDIIVIGASLGGLAALRRLTADLPANLKAAVLVVLHTHANSPRLLPEILGRGTSLPVSYAQQGDVVEVGHVYFAPPDRHLLLKPPGMCVLDAGAKVHFHRPAADPLFISAAETYGRRAIGVVLTGGDGDGTDGLIAIRRAGGIGIVQDPREAQEPSMPRSAVEGDHPDHVVSLSEMPALLLHLTDTAQVKTDAASGYPRWGRNGT